MEIKIGDKGRITLPLKIRASLGLKEGDSLMVEVTSRGILLKPKAPSSKELWGVAKIGRVEIEEIEEALGKES
ncbi:MAG: AbrB/MazE/SpoVT family DNA-binding domain-containing protein [Thermoproteota archaeon]